MPIAYCEQVYVSVINNFNFNFRGRRGGRPNQLLDQTRVEVLPTSQLPNSGAFHHCGAGRVVPSFGSGQLGKPQ